MLYSIISQILIYNKLWIISVSNYDMENFVNKK